MWSKFSGASAAGRGGGQPPPSPHNGHNFPPPPPPESTHQFPPPPPASSQQQQQQQQFPPPPPGGFGEGNPPPESSLLSSSSVFPPPPPPVTQQESSNDPNHAYDHENYERGEDNNGMDALGVTVNLVTSAASGLGSAASMFFRELRPDTPPAGFFDAPPPAPVPPLSDPNPPPSAVAVAVPAAVVPQSTPQFRPIPASSSTMVQHQPQPPEPIEQYSSMLDEVDENDDAFIDEDMTDVDMNADIDADVAVPTPVTATREFRPPSPAALLFQRPPTPPTTTMTMGHPQQQQHIVGGSAFRPPSSPGGGSISSFPPPPPSPGGRSSFPPPPPSPGGRSSFQPPPSSPGGAVFRPPPSPRGGAFRPPPSPTGVNRANPSPPLSVVGLRPPMIPPLTASTIPASRNIVEPAPESSCQNIFAAPPLVQDSSTNNNDNVFNQPVPSSQSSKIVTAESTKNIFTAPPPPVQDNNNVFDQPAPPSQSSKIATVESSQNIFAAPPPAQNNNMFDQPAPSSQPSKIASAESSRNIFAAPPPAQDNNMFDHPAPPFQSPSPPFDVVSGQHSTEASCGDRLAPASLLQTPEVSTISSFPPPPLPPVADAHDSLMSTTPDVMFGGAAVASQVTATEKSSTTMFVQNNTSSDVFAQPPPPPSEDRMIQDNAFTHPPPQTNITRVEESKDDNDVVVANIFGQPPPSSSELDYDDGFDTVELFSQPSPLPLSTSLVDVGNNKKVDDDLETNIPSTISPSQESHSAFAFPPPQSTNITTTASPMLETINNSAMQIAPVPVAETLTNASATVPLPPSSSSSSQQLHGITPPVSPKSSSTAANDGTPTTQINNGDKNNNNGDDGPLTPLITNQSQSVVSSTQSTPTHTSTREDEENSSKKTTSTASTSMLTPIRRQLRAPPPRSPMIGSAAAGSSGTVRRNKFKLPTPRKHKRSSTPVRKSERKQDTNLSSASSPLSSSTERMQQQQQGEKEKDQTLKTSLPTSKKSTKKPPLIPNFENISTVAPEDNASSIDVNVNAITEAASLKGELSNASQPLTDAKSTMKPSATTHSSSSHSENVAPLPTDVSIGVITANSNSIMPVDVTATEPTQDPPLPDGWSETLDPITQQMYFYNSISGETLWERPTPTIVNGVYNKSEAAITAIPNENTYEDTSVNDCDGKTDENQFEKKKIQEVATPSVDKNIDGLNADTAGASAGESLNDNNDNDQVEKELPDGWIEELDPSSGRKYYYNHASGEVSWERPLRPIMQSNLSMTIDAESTNGGKNGYTEHVVINNKTDGPEVHNFFLTKEPEYSTDNIDGSTSNTADGCVKKAIIPDGWIQANDPSTGKSYYYNVVSGETSWELPAMDANVIVGNSESVTDVVDNDASDEADDEKIEQKGSSGITEESKRTEALRKECDEITTVDDAMDEQQQQQQQPVSELDQKQALPTNWEQVDDPSSGGSYFYNSITGETSLDRPVGNTCDINEPVVTQESVIEQAAATSRSEDENAVVDDLQSELISDQTVEGTEATPLTEKSDLPEGWNEVIKEDTGQIYYYNECTGETSWEKPAMKTEPNSTEQMLPQFDYSNGNNDENQAENIIIGELNGDKEDESLDEDPNAESTLPANWIESVDPSSGQNYYYNSVSGETRWERPLLDNDDDGDNETDVIIEEGFSEPEITNNEHVVPEEEIEPREHERVSVVDVPEIINEEEEKEEEEIRIHDEHSKLPDGWVEATDPASGLIYFSHSLSGRVSWERPSANPENTSSNNDESSILPNGWVEATDPASGLIYFSHPSSGRVSWERPSPNPETTNSLAIESIDATHEVDDDSASATAMSDIPKTEEKEDEEKIHDNGGSSNLPDGWIEATDSANANSDIDENIENKPNSTLPVGWDEVLDAATGEVLYYQNSVTNDVSFSRPACEEDVVDKGFVNEERIPTTEEETHQDQNVNDMDNNSPDSHERADNALSECWEEVEDPSNGNIYYYNNDTGESSWDRPTTVNNDKPGLEVANTTSHIETKETTEYDELEDEIVESGTLPEGWVKSLDPSTAETYYYNVTTQEVSWDVPTINENISDNMEQKKQSDEIQIPDEDTHEAEDENTYVLPDGWVESSDPSTGEIYYYHSLSDKVSREKPLIKKEIEHTETSGNSCANEAALQPEITDGKTNANEDGGDAHTTINHDDIHNELSNDWIESEDPRSGQTYYYNTATGETRWERPIPENAAAESSTINGTDGIPCDENNQKKVDNKKKAEDNTVDNNEELPDGWAEEEDLTSGEIYYCNFKTGETSWQRPNASEETKLDSSKIIDATDDNNDDYNNDYEAEMEDNKVEVLPAGWVEEKDPSNGETFYYNSISSETRSERPTDTVEESEVDSSVFPTQTEVLKEEINNKFINTDIGNASGDELPDGWVEEEDPTSGQVYYCNTFSGITSWDRPINSTEKSETDGLDKFNATQEKDTGVSGDDDDDDDDDVDDDYDDDSDNSDSDNSDSDDNDSDSDSDDDEDISDEDSDSQADDSGKENSKNGDVADLPDGWVQAEEPGTGQVYYFNSSSGETSWQRPVEEMEERDSGLPGSSYDENSEDASSRDDHDKNTDNGEKEEDADEVSDKLHNGWVEAKDPTGGQIYYYNTITEETSWEKPTCEVSSDAPAHDDTAGGFLNEEIERNKTKSISNGGSSAEYADDVAITDEFSDGNDEFVSEIPTEAAVEVEIALPDGWVELQDTTNGETYYYHNESGEARWDHPGNEQSPTEVTLQKSDQLETNIADEMDKIDDTNHAHVDDAYTDSVDNQDPLPEFWVEGVDEVDGKLYYLNSVTHEIKWERPKLEKSQKDAEKVDETENDNDISASLDDASGIALTPLPKGWIESADPTTGQVYYYNVESEETSWDKPNETCESLLRDQSTPNESIVGSTKRASTEDAAQLEYELDKPPGTESLDEWEEIDDPSSEKPYFFNRETGETSWDRPEGMNLLKKSSLVPSHDAKETRDDDANDDKDIVLQGWENVVDPSSGNSYWFNSDTQETSWEKPSNPVTNNDNGKVQEELIVVDETDEGNGNMIDDDIQSNNIRHDSIDVQNPKIGEITKHETIDPTLPEGWTESTDPSTDQIFYWNEITNETSWERPSDKINSTENQVGHQEQDTSPNVAQEPVSNNLLRYNFLIRGPLSSSYDKSSVVEFINSKAKSGDILWQLISIAAKSNGKLRSEHGVADRFSPEAAIVKLLLGRSNEDGATIPRRRRKKRYDIIVEEKSK